MLLAAWVLVALFLGSWWLRRASVLPVAILIVTIAVPFIAGGRLTSGVGHPSTILIAVGLVLCMTVRLRASLAEIRSHAFRYLGLAVVTLFAFISLRFTGSGAPAWEALFVPVGLVFIMRVGSSWGDAAQPMRNWFLGLAVSQVVISGLAWLTGGPFLWVQDYTAYYWFTPEYTRALGTTDHPLVLSLLLASAVPLLAGVRSKAMQLSLLMVLIAGLLLTESRTGLLAAVFGAMFLVFRRGTSFSTRLATVVAGAVGAVALFQGPLATAVLDKFEDDGGSTSVRLRAIDAFMRRIGDFSVVGWGQEGSTRFRFEEGLLSSLESAFLMLSVNYGVLFTIGYFLLALSFAFTARRPVDGARLAACVAVVIVQTFSSLATVGASGLIMWAFIALAATPGGETPIGEAAPLTQPRRRPDARRLSTSRATG